MKCLSKTKESVLILSTNDLKCIKWHVDAAFVVHPDHESHTGAMMTMGKGRVANISRKQKLDTRSSTTAEPVAADDVVVMTLWTKSFLEAQGHRIHKNMLCQDNKSTILLEENGERSSSNRARHLNIRHFFLTDQVKRKNISIEHCPTDDMSRDFTSKPPQGAKFHKFRNDLGVENCQLQRQFMWEPNQFFLFFVHACHARVVRTSHVKEDASKAQAIVA